VEGEVRRRPLEPFRVRSVEPPDGARGVLRDDPVLLVLTGPLDPDRLHEANVAVWEEQGLVPARMEPMDGGRVLVLRPRRLLRAGCLYRVRIEGLRDRRGREAPRVDSGFTTGPLSGVELGPLVSSRDC
jgi:hypothetical protein